MPHGKAERLIDRHGRAITDLRISVTDRCNYKCVYCRTGNEGAVYAELPIEDYLRMARVFVGLGIEKIRLTGGEPLLRRGLTGSGAGTEPVADAGWRAAGPGADHQWASAGGDGGAAARGGAEPHYGEHGRGGCGERFARITRVPGSYERVLGGMRAAKCAGLAPVKVNCVLLRGFNEDQIVPFAQFSRDEGVVVRFIEFMPLEEGRLWTAESVVSLKEIVEALGSYRPTGAHDAECAERDGGAVYLRRRRGRDWDHRAGDSGILRAMQPGAADVGRKDSDMSVFAERS